MNCNELVELVTEYFENALSGVDRQRFEDHLAECPGCTNYVAQIRETIVLTGSLTADDVDPEACDRLLIAFRGFNTQS